MNILILMMRLDDVVGLLIQAYYQQSKETKTMSRHKLPCTRCNVSVASTWRPGPCGSASLCNRCGILWTARPNRPRMVDLVVSEGVPTWVERDAQSMEWVKTNSADIKDSRVRMWFHNESEKLNYIQTTNKKRKFAHC